MYANAWLSVFAGAHYSLVFVSAVCCLSNFTSLVVWGSDKVNCFLGNSLICVERWLCDSTGPVSQQWTLHFSYFHPLALVQVVTKKADTKSVHIVTAKHSDPKEDIFWEDKVLQDYKLKLRYALFLWNLIQRFSQGLQDGEQHKHRSPIRDLLTFL